MASVGDILRKQRDGKMRAKELADAMVKEYSINEKTAYARMRKADRDKDGVVRELDPSDRSVTYRIITPAELQSVHRKQADYPAGDSLADLKRKRIHTRDLKQKVIQPWADGLANAIPDIIPEDKDMVSFPHEPEVDPTLFEDLRLHIDPRAFVLDDELKRMGTEINRKKVKMLDRIDRRVLEIFGDLDLDLSDEWRRKNSVNRRPPI